MVEASIACSTSFPSLYLPGTVHGNTNAARPVRFRITSLKVEFPKSLRQCHLSIAKLDSKSSCGVGRNNPAVCKSKEHLLFQDSALAVPCRITSSEKKKMRVAVDVDEVLCSFLHSLNDFIAEKYEECYDMSEYYVYDYKQVWKCSEAEANHRVHEFYKSEPFRHGMEPIPGAYQALRRLSPFCELVVVTSRQYVIRQDSLDWIARHYDGLFTEVHFGNHFAMQGPSVSKSEMCKALNVQFLIDDNPRYAVECAMEGIEVLLFDYENTYPWSKTEDGPSHLLITRVQNWHDVEDMLMASIRS